MKLTKVYVEPRFNMEEDHGEGGIKQVIRHVIPYLEKMKCRFVDKPQDADVVWYHAAPYQTTKLWLQSHPEVPVVDSMHGAYWHEYDWDRGSLDANSDVIEAMRLADIVTVPSKWVAEAVNRGISVDLHIVPHGVDVEEFTPKTQPDSYLLFDKSRVDPVCDPTPVYDLAQRLPDMRFVMTGDPQTSLPNILKMGRIPYEDAVELTRSAGLYLCVTRETFGLATLQAMAAGVPVVGYRFGGQAEIVGDGGILVEPGDIDALTRAVVEARTSRAQLSDAARARAAVYTWQKAADGYLAAFHAALDAHASKVRCTVITTAYNVERTIRRTIDSVWAAMGEDDEYIIVDDKSTDDTLRIILDEALPHQERIHVVQRTENGYLAQARNDALARARGRYVACVDADDELTPDALNVLAGELDRDRTTQIAYGKVYFMGDYPNPDGIGIDERPEQYNDGRGYPLAPGASQWPFPYHWPTQNRADNVTCLPYSSMVRTAWLKRAGGWRTRCRTGEDIDLWMRLVSFGARPRMVTEADCLIYHTSTTSMSITNRLPEWGMWYPWTGAAGQVCMPPWGVAAPPPTGQLAWPVSSQADPQVTVVIPCGPGHDRYVLDAVDSVMAQVYRRWRCVVVNDTGAPLATRLPAWVESIERPEAVEAGAQGVAAARNAGLAAVATQYTVFLDADDWLDRDALQYLVASLESRPDLAVVYPDYWERDPRPDAERPGRVQYDYNVRTELPDWSCDQAGLPGTLYGITAIYRTEALRAVGGFDVEAAGWEDGDLQMALAYAGYCAGHLPRRAFVYARDRGTVATWHHEDKDERAERIIGWLRNKYRGKEMACGSCGGGRVSPPPMPMDGGSDALVLSGGMTEVEYVGALGAPFTIRGGQTGVDYIFGKGRDSRKPVLNEDIAFFDASVEYVVRHEAPPQSPNAKPSLTIDGPPHGRRAAVA